jgi:hypothetical protein
MTASANWHETSAGLLDGKPAIQAGRESGCIDSRKDAMKNAAETANSMKLMTSR